MKKNVLIFFFLLICRVSFAQKNVFPDNSKVAFIGNSITHGGEFHHNIMLFYQTRFPDLNVDFFNCGISGDVTGGILKRLDDDILIHKPTHAVIMIGMNDVKRNLYTSSISQNADTLKLREEALSTYKNNLESIIQKLIEKKISIIIQTPSIYDQTAILKTNNNLCANDALKKCAEFGKEFAQKYNLEVVDYWTIMSEINQSQQKINPSFTIVGNDRVHPGLDGSFVMTYQFLKSTNQPKYVSQIVIDRNSPTNTALNKNCIVSDMSLKDNDLIFSILEKSLPFPVGDTYPKALELVPFSEELNQQNFTIKNLKKGNYQLKIDTVVVGFFEENVLEKGINLSKFPTTPQFTQAKKVKDILDKYWQNESKLRNIKWTEYSHLRELTDLSDLQKVNQYLENRFEKLFKSSPYGNYINSEFKKYSENKLNENLIIAEMNKLKNEAKNMAKPVRHTCQISWNNDGK